MKANKIESTSVDLISSKKRMESVSSISPITHKWLIALGMLQDLRDYCHGISLEIADKTPYMDNHENAIKVSIESVRETINKCITDQILFSTLGMTENVKSI